MWILICGKKGEDRVSGACGLSGILGITYLCQRKYGLTTPDFCDRHRSRVSFRSIYEFWEFVVKPGLWRE